MESFFALLQKNVLDQQRWTTRAELRLVSCVSNSLYMLWNWVCRGLDDRRCCWS